MRSFTVKDPSPRGKREAEKLAAEWAAEKEINRTATTMTVKEAAEHFLKAKDGVLSPSTKRAYNSMLRSRFEPINNIKMDRLNTSILQKWISGIASERSPKYTKNVWALFTAVSEMYSPGVAYNVKLPMLTPPELYTPSDEDIKVLLEHIADTPLELAVLLAAFGTLRRGEICALTSDDIVGNKVIVNKAVIEDGDELIVKTPKTSSSYREVELPDFVIEKLKRVDGRLIPYLPHNVTRRFKIAVEECGLPQFRFHDLRHYSASIMHAIGIPDQYIMKRGGWKTDHVMKAVYRNTIDEQNKKMTAAINSHFSEVVHTKVHTT